MADLLDMAYINSLPQLYLRQSRDDWWPVHDIDVETGLTRIDVCGRLDIVPIGGVLKFRDADGVEYDAEDFYVETRKALAATEPKK